MSRLNSLLRSTPILRGFTMKSPPYLVGSVLENRLGLPVGRILGKYAVRSLRPRSIAPPVSAMFSALDRVRMAVIQDFMTPNELAKLNAEHRTLRSQVQFKPFRERDGRLSVARMALTQNKELAPEFNRLLGQHPHIQSLGAAVARVNRASPTLELTIFRLDNPEAPDNDDENLLHADLHTPTLKCFYYLSDVDAGNGAFIYAKGSSRMSAARLRPECPDGPSEKRG